MKSINVISASVLAMAIMLLAIAIPASAVSAAQDSSDVFTYPYVEKELKNGLKVILVRTEYPDVVSMHIPVQTGSRNEIEPGKSGFAHFFEHMMFRGTDNYSQEEYGQILKNAGVDQNAYTSDDYTNYHITFTKADLEKMIEVEADRFQNLKYTEDQFRTEAQAVKGEYLKNNSNPVQKAFERIRDLAFTEHTYKHTTMGFFEDIENMPNLMDYSKEFFDRWYRPEYTTLIIVGDINPQRTLGWIDQYWGKWERGDYQVDIPLDVPQTEAKYEHIHWEAPTQPWLIAAFHGPASDVNDKAMASMDLMAELYFSSTSDVHQKLVVQEQLVDNFFPYFPSRKDPGLLYIGARLTDKSKMEYVREQIFATLAKARSELVSPRRLEALKSNLRYSFLSGLDNSDDIAQTLASFVHYERDPQSINKQYDSYLAVTPADIRDYANKYFVDSNRVMVTLSNDKKLADFSIDATIDDKVQIADEQGGGASFKVIDKTNSSPLIDVTWLFNTGAANEPEGQRGVAALTASMITQGGSASRSYQDIQKLMYPISGSFYSQIDKEMTAFRGRIHQDNLEQWYDVVSDQLLNPGWREEDFSRLKTRHINAIKTDLKSSNDEELGKEVLYAQLYPDHPYGTFNLGTVSDLEKLTLADVQSFYAANYTRNNLMLGMIGNLSDDIKRRLLKDMEQLPAGNALRQQILPAPELTGRHATLVEKDTQSTAVSFGFPIDVNRSHKDWVALWLARSWLGEHRSSNSHLYQRIREVRGMNYGDYAYIEYFPRGMFRSHPNTNLGRSQQIFQVWLRPLRSNNDAHFATRVAMFELQNMIANGLTQEQFEATRNYLDKFVGLLAKSQDRVLGYALDSEFYDTGEFTRHVRNELQKLNLADVNAAIKKHLQLDNIHFVFITSDAKDMRERLASDKPSPLSYNTDKSPELLEEDKLIEAAQLGLEKANITIVPVDEVFN